jgi:hypothetical protein
MIYIYAPSYPALKLMYYFHEKNEKITIVSSNREVLKACKIINIPVIEMNINILRPVSKNTSLSLKAWYRHFKSLDECVNSVVDNLKGGVFYFTVLCIDIVGLHVIQKISQKTHNLKLVFWSELQNPGGLKNVWPKTVSEFKYFLLSNILYSPIYSYKEDTSGRYLFVGDRFIRKNNIKIWNSLKPHYSNSSIINLNLESEFVVILGGYSLEIDSGFFDKNELCETYSLINNILDNVYYKPHPGPYKIDGCLNDFNLFPYDFLPIETLCKNIKLAIGVGSTVLPFLANKGVPSISLIKIISCHGIDRNEWVDMLQKSSKNLLFPSTLDELKELLNYYA